MNFLWIFFHLFRLTFEFGKLFISIKLVGSCVKRPMKAHPVRLSFSIWCAFIITNVAQFYLTFIHLKPSRLRRIFLSPFFLFLVLLLSLPSPPPSSPLVLLLLSLKYAHHDFDWKRNGKLFRMDILRCLTNTHSEINKLRKLLIKKSKRCTAWYGMAIGKPINQPIKSLQY